MTVLVDSDILIEVSRGRDAIMVSQWLELGCGVEQPLISSGMDRFFRWTRPNAQLPSNVAPSLQLGNAEMKKLDLREP